LVLQDIVKETNAQYNPQYNAYTIDCNAKFTWYVTLSGTRFAIDEKSGILKYDDNLCVLAFEAMEDDPAFILDKFFWIWEIKWG
jgi:hypothetical protein